MKNKTTAGLLAIFLGWLGVHKFYLDRTAQGILYIVFMWTLIPLIVSIIEGIIYLTMSEEAFNLKYNMPKIPFVYPGFGVGQQAINVNVNNGGGNLETHKSPTDKVPVSEQIQKLYKLKLEGVLTEDEFVEKKKKMLEAI